jgi:hypothetical protein|tara:strand:- start:708 stop:1205 length:498 start_codon:yes stop_codon:yes gene_type:complete
MSSPFQKNFSAKSPMSPLNGAYTEGRDRDITTYRQSDRELFDKLQNDILGATLASLPTQEEKGEAQVRRADRRDAREEAGGSKVKKFLDKNKLGFLTADYKKDSNKDGTTDYKDKTAKIKAKGEKNITEGSTKSEETFNRKQTSICSRKVGYKGWDPVSGTCIPE